MWSVLQAERRAGKTVLLEQLAAREEERQLAAETLARERAAMAVQVPPAAVVAFCHGWGRAHLFWTGRSWAPGMSISVMMASTWSIPNNASVQRDSKPFSAVACRQPYGLLEFVKFKHGSYGALSHVALVPLCIIVNPAMTATL